MAHDSANTSAKGQASCKGWHDDCRPTEADLDHLHLLRLAFLAKKCSVLPAAPRKFKVFCTRSLLSPCRALGTSWKSCSMTAPSTGLPSSRTDSRRGATDSAWGSGHHVRPLTILLSFTKRNSFLMNQKFSGTNAPLQRSAWYLSLPRLCVERLAALEGEVL